MGPKVLLCGGPRDGEWYEWQGMELLFPFTDEQHAAEHRKWFDVFEASLRSSLNSRTSSGGGQPRLASPCWVYRAERGPYGVGVLGVYDGERR